MNNRLEKLEKTSFSACVRILEKELPPGVDSAYIRFQGQNIIILSSHLTAPQANVTFAKALGHLACNSGNHLTASSDRIRQESHAADAWAYEFLLTPETLADAIDALSPNITPAVLAQTLCVTLPFLQSAILHLQIKHGDTLQTEHFILSLYPNLQVKRRPPGAKCTEDNTP